MTANEALEKAFVLMELLQIDRVVQYVTLPW